MKNILFILLLTSFAFAQEVREIGSGTIANSATTSSHTLTNFRNANNDLDSVVIVIYAKGEIDVDSLFVQRGININSLTSYYTGVATSDSTILTINLDSAATTLVFAKTLTKAMLREANVIRVKIKAGSSGNDATDPNNYRIYAWIYK